MTLCPILFTGRLIMSLNFQPQINLSVIANKKRMCSYNTLFPVQEFLQFKNLLKGNMNSGYNLLQLASCTVENESKFLFDKLLLILILIRVSHELLRQTSKLLKAALPTVDFYH